MKHFRKSIVFTICALILAGAVGFLQSGQILAALADVFLAAVLGVMETSLSLDNAIVNSKILETMDHKWQQRFINWGIPFAVFGMRIAFPLAIVSVAGMVNPFEAIRIALFDHALYEKILTSSHVGIAGFGGAFLLLVALHFFISDEKEHHWFTAIEKPVAALGGLKGAAYIVAVVLLAIAAYFAGPDAETFSIAAACGIGGYFAVQKFGDYMGTKDATGAVVRSGIASFVYLEVLDASFSFDGVIGAFAITNDILIIACGLGIGAMFVRSMTVALVEGGHMGEYRFLEHGAFWAIISLAAIMVSVHVQVPEYVTGLIGVVLIGAAFMHSKAHRKAHPEEYVEDEEGEAPLPTGEVPAGRLVA